MSQSARHGVTVGTVLAETYEITGLLGEGGMGAVWEAQHRRLHGKKVAIKVLHSFVAGDSESVERFHREAQIASRLGHPNIVSVEDFNALPGGGWYLVLEHLKGESLNARLNRGPIPLPQALSITRQIASALQAAHSEGIVHRDLKPHNVFLCPSESHGYATELVKVLDFGISKIQGSDTVKTQTNAILGTPQYMSPEQARGAHREIDHRTDVFALGAIVYEMLTGRPAFLGESIPEVMFKVVYQEPPPLGELVPSLPPSVIAAVEHALAKSRDQRCESASAFVEALTGDPLITLRGGPATANMPRPGMSPSLAAMAASRNRVASMSQASSPEAFAATMATGDAAQPVPDPLAATLPPPGASAGPAFAGSTMPQISRGPDAYSPAETGGPPVAAAPVNLPTHSHGNMGYTSPDVDRPRHAARRNVVPIALGVAAMITTFSVVLALRAGRSSDDAVRAGDTTTAPAVAPAAATTGPAPGTNTTPATGTGQPPQATGTEAAAGTDPGNGKPKPGATAGATQPDDGKDPDRPRDPGTHPRRQADSEDIPASLQQELDAAEALLKTNPENAFRRASKTLGTQETSRAAFIMTLARCHQGDLGGANAGFQRIKVRALRRQAKKLCEDREILLRGQGGASTGAERRPGT
jgi:serine/threonine-protein kinase